MTDLELNEKLRDLIAKHYVDNNKQVCVQSISVNWATYIGGDASIANIDIYTNYISR